MEKVVLEIGGPSYLCPQDLCRVNKPKKSDWCERGASKLSSIGPGISLGVLLIYSVSVSPLRCRAGVSCGREPLFCSYCLDKNPDSP